MNIGIVGGTGFIGSNLCKQFYPCTKFNSENINDIKGNKFDIVINSAPSGVKWLANKNPDRDLSSIHSLITKLKKVSTSKFILISTIDIFETPLDTYEEDVSSSKKHHPYGRNRLHLEKFAQDNFKDCFIIRMPIVYGDGFKKNFLFDLLNNNEVEKLNPNSLVQVYNVDNLKKDIEFMIEKDIHVLNMATFPISIGEIASRIFSREGLNYKKVNGFYKTNMKTNYSFTKNDSNGYLYNKNDVIEDLVKYFS